MRTLLIFLILFVFISLISCASTGSCINKETGVNECQQRRFENFNQRGGKF